jgi:hypothetical protein
MAVLMLKSSLKNPKKQQTPTRSTARPQSGFQYAKKDSLKNKLSNKDALLF